MYPADDQPTVWKTEPLFAPWADTIRAAVPLAIPQFDLLVRIATTVVPDPRRALDLGAGSGLLASALLSVYPACTVTLIDNLAPALLFAEQQLAAHGDRAQFVETDYSTAAWLGSVRASVPFDLIVAGLALHRLDDPRKQALIAELYDVLAPGGWVLLLDYVAATSGLLARAWDDLVIDSRFAFYQAQGIDKLRHDVDWDWHNRNDADQDRLAPLDRHLAWLTQAGFVQVDVHFKALQVALVGGQKPTS